MHHGLQRKGMGGKGWRLFPKPSRMAGPGISPTQTGGDYWGSFTGSFRHSPARRIKFPPEELNPVKRRYFPLAGGLALFRRVAFEAPAGGNSLAAIISGTMKRIHGAISGRVFSMKNENCRNRDAIEAQ